MTEQGLIYECSITPKIVVIIIIVAVVLAMVYGFYPKAINVDLVDVTRGPLQVTIEEEGRTR